jgi:shikimate kinase
LRGVGSATGAVSFLNALFTGVGAAAAIDLPARATVELEPTDEEDRPSVTLDSASDTPLVRAMVESAVRTFGGGRRFRVRASVTSSIPAAVGLKSSSAVSVAVGRAIADALRAAATPESLARLSADVSQSVGLSATGAFDDAMAAAGGGLVVTDNTTRRVLARADLPAEWTVLLWLGRGEHAPSVRWREPFRAASSLAGPAVQAVDRGDWLTAMEANTRLVESILSYDLSAWRERLRTAGALASGVSGLGPALATIVPRNGRGEILRGHPAGPDAVQLREFVPGHSPGGPDR